MFLGDTIGKLLALISLAPFGIGAGFVTLILFRRDLHTVRNKNFYLNDTQFLFSLHEYTQRCVLLLKMQQLYV